MGIPVTILGGYLGAGKTTLINRILAKQNPSRLAVFVNDFGDVNIDAALIESKTDNVVSLTNGCVCCSIGDDLGKALFELLESDQPTDHILIEASGAADPARIAGYASGDPRLESPAVITIADSETVRGRAQDKFVGKLVKRQLTSAHLIALSKSDLVASEKFNHVFSWAETLAPSIPIVDAHDLENLLISNSHDEDQSASLHHLPHFTTFTFGSERALDRDAFHQVMADLPETIWRAKGFVRFTDRSKALIQKVGARLDVTPFDKISDQKTTLVFISATETIDSAEILSKLHACCEK